MNDIKISAKGRYVLDHPEMAEAISKSLSEKPLEYGEIREVRPGLKVSLENHHQRQLTPAEQRWEGISLMVGGLLLLWAMYG